MSRISPSPASAAAAAVKSYLAFDFGTVRVGVASGNTVLGHASPLKTLVADKDQRFVLIAQLIDDWQPDALVVGVPFHPDGAAHDNTRRAQRFARQLQGRFRLPVHEVDERFTTTEALSLQTHGAAGDVDAQSAALILNQFLREAAHAAP